MDIRRPFQVLALGLLSSAGTARLAAGMDRGPLAVPNIASNITHSQPASLAPLDGDDLEVTVDKLASLFAMPDDGDRARAYMHKLRKAAKYPVSCEEQVLMMLVLDSNNMPIKNEKGEKIAEFRAGSNTLVVLDKQKFEATNLCRTGENEMSPQSTLTATGFVMKVEQALEAKNPEINPAAERTFAAYAGIDIMAKARVLPDCNNDLLKAIVTIRNMEGPDPNPTGVEISLPRSRLIQQLAEKAFVNGGECNMRYGLAQPGQ